MYRRRSFVVVINILGVTLLLLAAISAHLRVSRLGVHGRVVHQTCVATATHAFLPEVSKQNEALRAQLPLPSVLESPTALSRVGVMDSVAVVDYTKTLDQLIDAGHYDHVSGYIIGGKFSDIVTPERIDASVELIHYDGFMTGNAVLENLSARGYRPATLRELALFAATHNDEPKLNSIVALGSVALSSKGMRFVSQIQRNTGGSRSFVVDYNYGDSFSGTWSESYWFAAIRK